MEGENMKQVTIYESPTGVDPGYSLKLYLVTGYINDVYQARAVTATCKWSAIIKAQELGMRNVSVSAM